MPRGVGLSAFYRQFWQRVRASRKVSAWRSRRVARDALASPPSPRGTDLGRNSRLSLRLAPFGLTGVGSGPTDPNPLGLLSDSSPLDSRTSGSRGTKVTPRCGILTAIVVAALFAALNDGGSFHRGVWRRIPTAGGRCNDDAIACRKRSA